VRKAVTPPASAAGAAAERSGDQDPASKPAGAG